EEHEEGAEHDAVKSKAPIGSFLSMVRTEQPSCHATSARFRVTVRELTADRPRSVRSVDPLCAPEVTAMRRTALFSFSLLTACGGPRVQQADVHAPVVPMTA